MKFIPVKFVNPAWFCVLMFCACLALAGPSMAQNQYYVNASVGSDSNDGSQARPWKTIQHAAAALTVGASGSCNAATGWLSVANVGACVHVAPGNYGGDVTTNKSGTASARVVYISETKWGAKIVNASVQLAGDYSDFDGFDITNPGPVSYGMNVVGHHHNVQYNYLHDFSVNSCGQFGALNETNQPSGQNTFNGNIIRHAGNYSSTDAGTVNFCTTLHGIYSQGQNTVITNNVISGISGWGIKRNMAPTAPGPGVISNNTIFNNGGGVLFTEDSNSGFAAIWDYNTVSNNIIVNNGVDAPNGGRYGMNFYHVTGTHNLVTNNVIYGNKPSDYAHHDVTCTGGTPISGSDANGTAGGCPSTNPKSDPGTSATFTNFQSDTNTASASNYDLSNYQIRAGSNAIQNGTANCASSPGLAPCVPATDIVGVIRPSGSLDIGVYQLGSVAAGLPSAPTGLTAVVQ